MRGQRTADAETDQADAPAVGQGVDPMHQRLERLGRVDAGVRELHDLVARLPED